MNNSIKQLSSTGSIFYSGHSTNTTKEYSLREQLYLPEKYAGFGTRTSISMPDDKLSDKILFEINKLKSFLHLTQNWDSYNALPPSMIAVDNSIEFILRLANRQLNPFYIAPSPNGDILVELKQNNVSLEFFFSEEGTNQIIGLVDDEEIFRKELNETNESCSLKWLYCPDGNCFNL